MKHNYHLLMPQRKRMETPSKQPERSTITHEEEEETQHDISKLRDQVQQISLSHKVTKANMDGLKKVMEAKMNGVEANINDMESKMDGLKVNIKDLKKDMEGLKGGLAKLLQVMIPNGEKVVEETHNENKKNANHDSIQYNVGLKTHHVLKINMRKFDGKDPATCILQMEQYFDLHNVQNTQKVRIATLYLELNQFVWYRWLFSPKQIVT